MKKLIFILAVLLIAADLVAAPKGKTLNVATYNLRNNNKGDGINSWPYRKEEVKALIRYHEFDVFGTQEGLYDQLTDLLEMNEYAYVGGGRDDGKQAGEHSAILYRKDRFKLLEHGDFWLSETPDKPGKGWDATCCNRICSWARFRDLENKKDFYFFSVHFDHQGVKARVESGKLMVKKITEIAGAAPVICVGDLNSTPETEQVKTMKSLMQDSYEATKMPPYGPEGTFNGFNYQAPLNNRIDYIFVSDQFSVLKYGVLTDSYDQKFPSDHLPVVIKAAFTNN
ncbi:MAG: endonuclease/exonuclease/phosphatase family protein [Mangrovibacterium sp.]